MAVSVIVVSLCHGRMSAIDVITVAIVALTVVIAITVAFGLVECLGCCVANSLLS